MNIRDLEYLLAIAQTGHFGRAALQCHVSQPTLSAQLKKLEDELGVVLVERHSRRVWLTPAGQSAVVYARRVLDEVQHIKDLARQGEGLNGPLRLSAIPTVGPYLFPHLVGMMRQKFATVKPLLREDKTDDLLPLLRTGQVDAGFLAIPLPGEHDDLVVAPVYEEPFCLLLPEGHALLKRKQIREEDLRGERLLLLEDGHCLREQALSVCRRLGAGEREDFRATSLETLRQMVAAGVGCTLLPVLALEGPLPPGVVARPFAAPVPGRQVALVWRRGYPAGSGLRHLADELARTMAETLASDRLKQV